MVDQERLQGFPHLTVYDFALPRSFDLNCHLGLYVVLVEGAVFNIKSFCQSSLTI